MRKQLKATCDFKDGLLVCQVPKDVVEVELKVKTRWGKHTLIEDQHSRTEKFCPWDRADRRVMIKKKKRECPNILTLTMMTPKVTQWTPLTWAHIYPQVEDLTTPSHIY